MNGITSRAENVLTEVSTRVSTLTSIRTTIWTASLAWIGRYRLCVWLTFFCLVGTAAATYLHWPALTHYTTYRSDIRQCPHWAAYHQTSFREDDLLLEHAAFNESPIQNLIFYAGTFFVDMVVLTKLVAVVSYGLVAGLFFFLGQSMLGFRAGALAALFFTFFPDQFTYFSGGFSKAWMIPLLLVCTFILERKRWRGLLLLMPLAALAYPMATVLIGLTVLIYLLLQLSTEREEAIVGFRSLVVGSGLALAPLVLKYVNPPLDIGPMTSGAELLAMPEMYRGGLSPYLPIPKLSKELLSHVSHPFVIYSALLFFFLFT